MLARFKEVCDTVLTYRDHKDRLVRKNVIQVRRARALRGQRTIHGSEISTFLFGLPK
jgi:hypothetical protein